MRFTIACPMLLMALGCGRSPIAPDTSVGDLRAAPTQVTIGGVPITLQVHLWRDFMPITPPGGPQLRVSIQLPDQASSMTVDRIWVLYGEDLWSTVPARNAGTNVWVAGNGPQWGPGVTVDVVAQVRHPSGDLRLVRAAAQPIVATF
jgi:hypothetical protein